MWRTNNDYGTTGRSVLGNFPIKRRWPRTPGPGQWNDPDMLEVGAAG